jgi:hypothetical protein
MHVRDEGQRVPVTPQSIEALTGAYERDGQAALDRVLGAHTVRCRTVLAQGRLGVDVL